MIIYQGTFIKGTGEARTMRFIKINDLPDGFIKDKVKGKRKSATLKENKELVWDVDKKDFRIFNWSTKVGEVQKNSVSNDILDIQT